VKLDRGALDAHPLPPVVDGDKETKGRILVIAGSREVPGAALLTATAAMRAGAGKLRIAAVDSIAVPVGIAMPEAMVVGLPEDEQGGFAEAAVKAITEQATKVDAVVAGPGMAQGKACARIAEALVASEARIALDAALLHALQPLTAERSTAPILLPHSGELASLLDCDEEAIERDPVGCGRRAAEAYRSIVVVKGVSSHVVTGNGEFWTYEGGAPGLGVSGSGDVLAGIVGGLLARGTEPLNALLWAVWLHGEAGAALAKRIGPIGFLAREIADEIPALLPT
jgi:ADP-dependent NAD(P)H-hydrate dehydratase